MTWLFWTIVALLLAGGLLFVLPPLMRGSTQTQAGPGWMNVYREQRAELDQQLADRSITPEEHAQSMLELQHRVVDETPEETVLPVRRATPAAMLAVALVLPAGALVLYGLLGKPGALAPAAATAASADGNAPHTMSREQMEQLVERLAERLKQSPNDADGWHMLARSYVAFGRLPEAAEAYDKAAKLAPKDPQLLADYADTLALVNGRSLEGRPLELVRAALKIDPNHQKSLALAGTAAFNRGDFAEAVSHWKKLQAQLPPDSEGGRSTAASIAQAEEAMRGGAGAKPGAPTTLAKAAPGAPSGDGGAPSPGAAGGSVQGTVTVSESLRARIGPNDTLFVFARPAAGRGIPLAIQRGAATQLPFTFKLDDSLAMSPEMRISGQEKVMLGARISKSGNATPQSGDLLGTLGPVAVGSHDVRVVIDGVVP